jgi:hypothetical protein
VKLPARQEREYLRPPKRSEHLVPERYAVRNGGKRTTDADPD